MGDNREHMLVTLASYFVKNSENRKSYDGFFSAAHELQLFGIKKGTAVQDVIGQANSALNSSKDRLEGLCLLHYLVEQVQTETFSQNAATWLRMLVQVLQSYDPPLTLKLACHVTGEILHHASGFPELTRELATSSVPQILSALLAAKLEWVGAAMTCLSQCLLYFHGPCGPVKNKIEALVVPALGGHCPELVEEASQCYAHLSRAGGGGNQGIKHTEAWTQLCDKLLGSLQDTLLNALYRDIDLVSGDGSIPQSRLSLDPVPEMEPQRTFLLQARFTALTRTLSKMLSTEFSAVAQVHIEGIIGIICTAMSVTPRTLAGGMTQDKILLCSALPIIHRDALRLLTTLISSCGQHMVIHAGLVNRLLLQTLNWSEPTEDQYGQDRPYGVLRAEVYLTAQQWLATMGASAAMETVAGQLLPHLLKDANPQKDNLKLEDKIQPKQQEKHMGGKKKHKHGWGDLGQLKGQRKLNLTANSEVCSEALDVLRLLILKAGCFLQVKHYKSIVEFLIPVLMEVQQSTSAPVPYSSALCRRKLYHLLQTCVVASHPSWPPPTQCAVKLFSFGQQDNNLDVAGFCAEALAICECIIHPRAPTLHTPLKVGSPQVTVDQQPIHRMLMENWTMGGKTPPQQRMVVDNRVPQKSSCVLIPDPIPYRGPPPGCVMAGRGPVSQNREADRGHTPGHSPGHTPGHTPVHTPVKGQDRMGPIVIESEEEDSGEDSVEVIESREDCARREQQRTRMDVPGGHVAKANPARTGYTTASHPIVVEATGSDRLTLGQDRVFRIDCDSPINGHEDSVVVQDDDTGHQDGTVLQSKDIGNKDSTVRQDIEHQGDTVGQEVENSHGDSTVRQEEEHTQQNSTVGQDETAQQNSTIRQEDETAPQNNTVTQEKENGHKDITDVQDGTAPSSTTEVQSELPGPSGEEVTADDNQGTSQKRKHDDDQEEDVSTAKKHQIDDTEMMLSTFVDAGPDSD